MSDTLVAELKSFYSSNPKNFTSFRLDIEKILKVHIKPLTKEIKNNKNNSWRTELKQRFAGRGAKWVFVSLENIESRLSVLELEGIDCSDYRKNINKLGKAWIRFSGARINNGIKCAAFEVRTEGSTIDHPKQLHLIYIDSLDDLIETMPGTPKSLKIEEDSAPMPRKPKVIPARRASQTESTQELSQEINVELNKSPDSNNPDDWEAFLAAEGLVDDDMDLL